MHSGMGERLQRCYTPSALVPAPPATRLLNTSHPSTGEAVVPVPHNHASTIPNPPPLNCYRGTVRFPCHVFANTDTPPAGNMRSHGPWFGGALHSPVDQGYGRGGTFRSFFFHQFRAIRASHYSTPFSVLSFRTFAFRDIHRHGIA